MKSNCTAGTKVKVWNGDRSQYLGEGTLVGFATVFVAKASDGRLLSSDNPEARPPGKVPIDQVQRLENNPKILLKNGQIVYGCQVWWQSEEDTKHREETELDVVKYWADLKRQLIEIIDKCSDEELPPRAKELVEFVRSVKENNPEEIAMALIVLERAGVLVEKTRDSDPPVAPEQA